MMTCKQEFGKCQSKLIRVIQSGEIVHTSPWAALVPSTSGIPLPMMVLAMMIVGLPLSRLLALAMEASMAPKSWPETFNRFNG